MRDTLGGESARSRSAWITGAVEFELGARGSEAPTNGGGEARCFGAALETEGTLGGVGSTGEARLALEVATFAVALVLAVAASTPRNGALGERSRRAMKPSAANAVAPNPKILARRHAAEERTAGGASAEREYVPPTSLP